MSNRADNLYLRLTSLLPLIWVKLSACGVSTGGGSTLAMPPKKGGSKKQDAKKKVNDIPIHWRFSKLPSPRGSGIHVHEIVVTCRIKLSKTKPSDSKIRASPKRCSSM